MSPSSPSVKLDWDEIDSGLNAEHHKEQVVGYKITEHLDQPEISLDKATMIVENKSIGLMS